MMSDKWTIESRIAQTSRVHKSISVKTFILHYVYKKGWTIQLIHNTFHFFHQTFTIPLSPTSPRVYWFSESVFWLPLSSKLFTLHFGALLFTGDVVLTVMGLTDQVNLGHFLNQCPFSVQRVHFPAARRAANSSGDRQCVGGLLIPSFFLRPSLEFMAFIIIERLCWAGMTYR